jgi:hypothetical protein
MSNETDPEVQPKDRSVFLLITNNESVPRIFEHVGGNELAIMIARRWKECQDTGELYKKNDSLLDPVGTDVYGMTCDYFASIQGVLNLVTPIDVTNDLGSSDNIFLFINS